MTVRRPPPGPQVAAGRVRVDAARAIAKLREYRLADPTAWILEAIRAAVAGGATGLRLDGDANDVWLRWAGPPWPAAQLPTLFDELVSPEPARDAYHHRLLAAAINSALGLEPLWVDVIAVADGGARRVRFTPATVTPGADGAAPLGELVAEELAVPAGADARGMVLHLRRRAGLETLGRFLRRGDPPELAAARQACADLAVPLTIGGEPIGRDVVSGDVLRVPLGEGLDGFVALIDPHAAGRDWHAATLDVAELGVRVTHEAWAPAELGGAGAMAVTARPLRLVIDGPRMPTNASRAQVRHDAHPVAAALRRGDAVLGELAGQVEQALGGGAAADDDAALRERVRAAALALVASEVAGPEWARDARRLGGVLGRIAALPLVQNALGEWQPVAARWDARVYRGEAPLPAELATWVRPLPWIRPGDPAAVLLGDTPVDERATRRFLTDVKRRARARARFLATPPRPAELTPRLTSRVRLRLGAGPTGCVPDDRFAGLTGEVCVAARPGDGRLIALLEGRPLAAVALPPPLAIDAIIDGAQLTPDERYRDAVDDHERARAVRAARAAAVRAVEVLCLGGDHPDVAVSPREDGGDDDELVRGALMVAFEDGLTVADEHPLARAAVWPTSDGARVDLATLRRQTALGLAAPAVRVVAPAGRLVVHASAADRALLAGLLGDVALVPYDRAPAHAAPVVDPGLALARRLVETTGTATLVCREPTLCGAIAFATSSSLTLHHRGVALLTMGRTPALVDCAIALDSDALVPTPDWKGLAAVAGVSAHDVSGWERALVQATVHALLGDPTPDLLVPRRPLRLDDPTGQALCAALARHDLDALLGAELAARLRAHPMLRLLGGASPCSLDELGAAFPDGAVPVLAHAPPGLDAPLLDGWTPLLAADGPVRALVARVLGRPLSDGQPELERRARAAAAERRIASHRARPVEATGLPAAAWPVPLAEVRGQVGVRRDGGDGLDVTVTLEGRRFLQLPSRPDLPLAAVVDVELGDVDDELRQLREPAQVRLLTAVRLGAGRVLTAIARREPTRLLDDAPTRRLLEAWLARTPTAERDVHQVLRAAAMWPTVRGGQVAIADVDRVLGVPVATWNGGAWLAGEPAHVLDGPVIALPTDEAAATAWRAIIDALAGRPHDDVTIALRRLQAQRRVAHGVVRTPTVNPAAAPLRRRLDALEVRHDLGAGEIGLIDADHGRAVLHALGQPRATLELAVAPPVELAIEAPELVDALAEPGGLAPARKEQLTRQAQALATALTRQLLAAGPLPPPLRRRLRTAALRGQVAAAAPALDRTPLFELTSGEWVSWEVLAAQQATFGDVWYVTAPPPGPPLDPRRLVLILDAADVRAAARIDALVLKDAGEELALDQRARDNRARAPVRGLAVPTAVRVASLATVPLPERADGAHGWLVLLDPRAAALRGVHAHRGLVPLDPVDDPCAWPTWTIVEHPGLTLDRTASLPVRDAVWNQLCAQLHQLSLAAQQRLIEPPASARWSERISAWPGDRPAAAWGGSAVCGALWLVDGGRGTVRVATASGETELDAPEGVPVAGYLRVHPEPAGLYQAVATLCRVVGAQLVARATPATPPQPQLPPVPPPPRPLPPRRPAPPAPEPEPPHALRPLAEALLARLDQVTALGLIRPDVKIARRAAEPPVEITRKYLVLAGEAPLLRAVAAAVAVDHPAAATAVDAVAAHVITLLDHAHEPINDASQRDALLDLLR